MIYPVEGSIGTVFTFGREEDFDDAVADAKAEQELICGYDLKVLSTRQVQYKNELNQDVFEVYATFGPADKLEDDDASTDPET